MPVTALARRFRQDVSVDGVTWLQLMGVNDFNPSINPNIVDASNYDGGGWTGSEVVMQDWNTVTKFLRQPSAGVYPPSQELIRATQGLFGASARLYTRWYDRLGAPEAWSGLAIPSWQPSKTGTADLNEVTATLKGDGPLTPIANPYAAAAVPTITSALPSGQATGGLVTILGSGFVGTVVTTGVKFNAVNATSWTVVSDSCIVAVLPAGSAGSTPLIVTNAAGSSASFPYTHG